LEDWIKKKTGKKRAQHNGSTLKPLNSI
jgi:hypothetical protein